MSLHSGKNIPNPNLAVFDLTPSCRVHSKEEAANTHFVVLGFTSICLVSDLKTITKILGIFFTKNKHCQKKKNTSN